MTAQLSLHKTPHPSQRPSRKNRNFTRRFFFGFNGKESDNSTAADSYDFGARILDARIGRWLAVDPLWWQGPSYSSFNFALNSVLVLVDPSGGKEKPFEKGKSRPISNVPNSETPLGKRNERGELIEFGKDSFKAYNCHSYAWHNCGQDFNDSNNANNEEFDRNAPLWDNSPADDITEQNALQLRSDVRNKVGDRVIYFLDDDGDGIWSVGEEIAHAAIVDKVDNEGNTTEVRGKQGDGAISFNHPGAPGYYSNEGGKPLSRAYFRLKGNYQTLGSIRFDSDSAIPIMKADGKTIDYLVVQDINTGKDFGVIRNENGSYSWHQVESSGSEKEVK